MNDDIKCPQCGASDIMGGSLSSTGGMVFVPEGETGIVKKSAYITACACRKCGAVFGFKLSDKPNKLTED